jgi:hypothetical protein
MQWVLRLAGVYNLVWGLAVVVAPHWMFQNGGVARPGQTLTDVTLWQCLGMVIGVYGIGYLIASTDPLRHWPIVFVGFLGKIFGPIGFLDGALKGELPWSMAKTIAFNDVIWWVPFALILYRVYANYRDDVGLARPAPPAEALKTAVTNTGKSLAEMSHVTPVLLIFLRHFG